LKKVTSFALCCFAQSAEIATVWVSLTQDPKSLVVETAGASPAVSDLMVVEREAQELHRLIAETTMVATLLFHL